MAEVQSDVKLDTEGRVVYPTWDDVGIQELPRGICDVMPVNLVAKACFDGPPEDVFQAITECSALIAKMKGAHKINIPGPKKLMLFLTGRMITTAGESIGSSLMSLVTFVHLMNRIMSLNRGLDHTHTFVTITEYKITNIVLSGHTVPFDCDKQLYTMYGHIYFENPINYTGRSCPIKTVAPDGTVTYHGTITPYKSNNIILTGVRDLEGSLTEVLRQFSGHVGDAFEMDKPLGTLPEARVEDTGTKLEIFHDNL